MSVEELLELAERIHRIPSGEVSWESALARTSRLLNSRASLFMIYDLNRVEMLDIKYDNLSLEWLGLYNEYYIKVDPRVRFVTENPDVRVFSDYDFIDEAGMARSEYYQDYMIPGGFKYFGSVTPPSDSDGIRVTLVPQRAPEQGPFSAQDLMLLGTIATHFLQVYRLLNRIGSDTLTGFLATSTLERFTFPVLVVDRDTELAWANEAGRTLLDSNSTLSTCKRQLYAASPTETRRLRDLVHDACGIGLGPRGGAMTLTGRNGDQDASVVVAPLHLAQDDERLLRLPQRRFALLLVRQRHAEPLRGLDFMRQLYGLAGQECRLLELLVAGHDLRAASELLGVTYETSRQYLKQLFGKTGVRSQSQMMKVVLEHPAYFVDA